MLVVRVGIVDEGKKCMRWRQEKGTISRVLGRRERGWKGKGGNEEGWFNWWVRRKRTLTLSK